MFQKKVSSSTQPAILSRKSYDENKIQDYGKDLNIYEEIYIDDDQNKSSYVKDSATEIISMYETASLFLSCRNTDCSDYDSPFIPKSDSTYSYVEDLSYFSHQNQSKNDTCPQKLRSDYIYPMQLKRYTYQSIPPVVDKEQPLNNSYSGDTEIDEPIFSKPLKLLSNFPLDVGNSLPSLVIQSDEEENFYSCRQILSPLDSSPLAPIHNSRKILGCEKPIRKEDMINLDMSEVYTSSQASMINLYASIPLSPNFVPGKLQLISSNHYNHAKDSCSSGYIEKESLSYTSQPLIMCNRSSKNEKNFSQNYFKVSTTIHNFGANSFADRSSVNLMHFESLSIPHIAQKTLGITTNNSYANISTQENKKNCLEIKESKYKRYRAHNSRFELSKDSNKCLDSHRTSCTTIDQIEMDLNSKINEDSPHMKCCQSPDALFSYESVGYTTSTPDTLSKKSQSGQINSKLKTNQTFGSLKIFNSLETKNALKDAARSKILLCSPSSQLASKSKIRTTDISSSKAEVSKNPPLLILLEKKMQHGLKIDHPETTPLGSISVNQRKHFEASNINCLNNSALNSLPENQNCRDLEYDNFSHNQGSCALNRTMSLPIYDYNITAQKSIASTKQMKLKKTRPQLMKPLPPTPAVRYAITEKTLSIKDKVSDLELSLRFSPLLAGSETSSLKTESGESSGLKFTLPRRTFIHTDVEADKKTPEKIKSYDHDNSNNNQLKRAPPKLKLKAKKLQSFSSCPSILRNLDSTLQNGYGTAEALSNANLDLDRSKFLRSTGLKLKYSQPQNNFDGTIHIRRAPNSVKSAANLLHSNPSDLFTSHDYSNDIFGENINDLLSRRQSLDSDNLITSLPLSNIKTNGRKRIKKKKGFSGSLKGCLSPLDSSNIFESRLVISDDSSQIENHNEIKKKFDNCRNRRESLYTIQQLSRSKDDIRYRSYNNVEFHSIKTPKSTPNLHRKYFESVPCLKKEPQGQNLKSKIQDWIKSARSAISTRIESQAKAWRKKKMKSCNKKR
ncbi:hypothetical protein OnM2_049017 [Erysiphe neolycopersici]|uniref:Uncharacterized protein n=1 Tax=Erysiphe neolycopersici TaxID=212602 RepID=A0A420HT56_9PEZI|nr:hypothetical protein OnM2_049017 [Erysiphe neolycopersici]